MLTKEEYERIKRSDEIFFGSDFIKANTNRRNGWISYKPEEIPGELVPHVISNEEHSAAEVYEFVNNPPEKYFLYINEKDHTATTWTGDKLGTVRFGREYRSPAFGGFPSVRQSVRVEGINGVSYFGTYYKSSGNYARIKRAR